MSHTKKIALGAGAAAVALGVSLGATGMASATETATTATPAPSASSSAAAQSPTGDEATNERKGGHGQGRGGGGGVDAAGLASKLGLDEATVTDAFEAARDTARSGVGTTEGEKPDREALQSAVVASLAETLGVEEATVQTAIDELRAEKNAERSAAVQERLDTAVTDGSLTQAEADGATKAVELGILGGGKSRG